MTRRGTVADSELAELAAAAVGNWKRFESFGWHGRPDDSGGWCIVYTSNRDSRLLEQSNAAAIAEILAPFLNADTDDPDIQAESHGHWACGHVDGYSIRVYKPGTTEPTDAFRTWCEIHAALENYPVLDEEDYGRRECEATTENLRDAGGTLARREDWELPDDWEAATWRYLWDHTHALENRDDTGGYPSDDELRDAWRELGYRCAADADADDDDDTEPEPRDYPDHPRLFN